MANDPLLFVQPGYEDQIRRRLAQVLAERGASSAPVQHPMQGLSRIADAWTGAYMNKQSVS